MPNLTEIQTIVEKDSHMKRYAARRELKELPGILWQSEVLEHIVQGISDKKAGLLVATDKRLIFIIDKGLLWGIKSEIYPYEKITSIQYSVNALGAAMTVLSAGASIEISALNESTCKIICDKIQAKIENLSQTPVSQPVANSFITDLEKLAALYTQKLITEEEFSAAKRKLLDMK